MVGFYLNESLVVADACWSSNHKCIEFQVRDDMLAYASPSNRIAIVITGLVIDCLGTNNLLVDKSSLLKLI